MRLKQGSYYYMVGVFFFAAAFFAALLSGIFGACYRASFPPENPLLTAYAGAHAGSAPAIAGAFIFSVLSLFLAAYTMYSALRRNALIGPFYASGGISLLLAVLFAGFSVYLAVNVRDVPVFSFFRPIPMAAVGVLLFMACKNRRNVRMPLVISCFVSGVLMFVGLGYYSAMRVGAGYSGSQFLGFAAVFLISLSLAFFYAALAFCAAGSEPKPKKPKKPRDRAKKEQ